MQIVWSRDVHQPLYCCRLSRVAILVAVNTITSQASLSTRPLQLSYRGTFVCMFGCRQLSPCTFAREHNCCGSAYGSCCLFGTTGGVGFRPLYRGRFLKSLATQQPVMPIEDRLFDRGLMRSAMASEKSINVHISKYFMVV